MVGAVAKRAANRAERDGRAGEDIGAAEGRKVSVLLVPRLKGNRTGLAAGG